MGTDFPVEFHAQHVQVFLDKIARDRDLEIAAIDRQVAAEVAALRRQTHEQARQLARRVITATRERERRQRDRSMYKIRSELTRQRWQILDAVHSEVLSLANGLFMQAWRDPERQLQWCRYWVVSAQRLASSEALNIVCGAGTSDAVVGKLREMAAERPGEFSINVDEQRPAGLIIEWTDHELDGTLSKQCDALADGVLEQVAAILAEGETGVSEHE